MFIAGINKFKGGLTTRKQTNAIKNNMLDKYIKDKVDLISYSQQELSNIAATLKYLKSIINNDSDFNAPFLGGSYKRATMVKGISDVDVYFQFTGFGNSQSALSRLKRCLTTSYPTSIIKQDKPSILVDFNKIPINITPYKLDMYGSMSIPSNNLLSWKTINFGGLETAITELRQNNPQYIQLIKILKLWNCSYNKGLKNFDIEKRVCDLHIFPYNQTISDLIIRFLENNGFQKDAITFCTLKNSNYSNVTLKTEWLKFIDNK